MKNTLLMVLLCGLFWTSCQEKEKTPDYLWEMDRMVEVMTEVQLAEALVRLGYHRSADSMHVNDSVFNAAFRAVGTNRTDFDSNFQYYQNHPDLMEKVFEQLIANLSERSAELKADQLKGKEEQVELISEVEQ